MNLRSSLVLATATILVACGSVPAARGQSAATSSAAGDSSTPGSGSRLATPSLFPSPIADSPVAAGDWVTYVNHAGMFTFSAPAQWQVQSCEDKDGAYVVTSHGGESPPPCGRGEYNDAWLIAVSLSGDQRQMLPPTGNNYSYTAKITRTEDAVADGVHGNRYTAHVDETLPLPPPKGTDQVVYIFFNGFRTYAFWYDHWPTDPDRTTDFDKLVLQTLRFST